MRCLELVEVIAWWRRFYTTRSSQRFIRNAIARAPCSDAECVQRRRSAARVCLVDRLHDPVDAVVTPEGLASVHEQRDAEDRVFGGALDHAFDDAGLERDVVESGDGGLGIQA